MVAVLPLHARDVIRLTERTRHSVEDLLWLRDTARTDAPVSIDVPQCLRAEAVSVETELNEHQQALVTFSEYLETMIDDSAPKPMRAMKIQSGIANAQADAATE